VLGEKSHFFPARFTPRQNRQMHFDSVLFGRRNRFFFGADNAERTSVLSQILPFLFLSAGGAQPGSQKLGQALS